MPADQPDESMPSFTVATARVLAVVAHDRQKDKLKRPYREHVLAVGDALADFDDDIQIAGYLHDIAEDTPMTRQALLEMGVSERAVETIERLTNRLHENPDDYAAIIREIADDRDATLVKIADNAHNSLPERVKALAAKWPGKPPVTKYRDARPVLYAAVPAEDVRMILKRINPWLLPELDKLVNADHDADDNDYAADGDNVADTDRDAPSEHADDADNDHDGDAAANVDAGHDDADTVGGS